MSNERQEIDGNYCPEIKSRWKSYGNYRLIVWAWMMNEVTIMFTPTEISHNGFYAHAALQSLSVIFVGMPLVYSEICLAQYTNCNIFTMWNYFPLFQNMGYGTLYLIILKTLYLLVLSSWNLVYMFYSGLDVPPWVSCDDFNYTKCMVKRINVSIFQHCLEAQILFDDDCGMKTASNCFFEREIGDHCTAQTFKCFYSWKTLVAGITITFSIYVLSIRKERFFRAVVKFLAFYMCLVILVLFCVALSTSGSWYATKIALNWSNYNFRNCYASLTRGFLSLGTGYGIIIFLTQDASFRSPATMTSICTPLFSLFASLMFGLIAFSGIKTMSYYHGEEENVIEIGDSIYFPMFASMSEILGYFDAMPIWGFLWFSSIFISLYVNFWILYLFLKDLLLSLELAQKYCKLSCLFLMLFIILATLPFLCSDITGVLTDATEIIQCAHTLFFSISLYWIYGLHNHNVDIIFMIGIKANYFWKLTWLLNPIFLVSILYSRWINIETREYEDSYYITSINMDIDLLVFYIVLSIYSFIIIVGIIMRVTIYYRRGELRDILSPTKKWGPRDRILLRSRKMFVPEIMTREFLYRQVRIRGYYKARKGLTKPIEEHPSEESIIQMKWSALTSN